MASTIFVNPEGIKDNANTIRTYSAQIGEIIAEISTTIAGTESNYQSQAASDMREKFNSMKPSLDKFEAYLNKVATYLVQNVADTTSAVNNANVQNVASIRKPQK
ncbi:MAG: WXG100 family type VII secretion target [Ruminococcus sp.]|nr:WXG100 family type VII secretion target [Ruminococcus sp.]MDE7138637.1 WXG100 family type VII secretion target [Ruminococcus sp.]